MFDMTGCLLSSGVVYPQNTPEGTFIVVFKDEPKYALRVSFSSHNVFCQDRRIPYETWRICEHCLGVAQKENILQESLSYFERWNVLKKGKLSKCSWLKDSNLHQKRKVIISEKWPSTSCFFLNICFKMILNHSANQSMRKTVLLFQMQPLKLQIRKSQETS